MVAIVSATIAAVCLGAPSRAAGAQDGGVRCDEGDSIRVLFLLDTSTSLLTNDPDGRRTSGTIDALSDLYGIFDDYRPRLLQYFPGWSVFVAVDTFSGFNSDPSSSNPYSRLSGEWRDIGSPSNRQHLLQAARDVQSAPGSWTDYREALAGALQRFADPVPGSLDTCDYLFWFTDGTHDTVAAGVFTDVEEEEVAGMCRSGGLVDQLRQADVNVTAIELRVDRESSDQLRRLVLGQGSDCAGLNGKITDVASVADLASQIEETVYRLVDLDFPVEFVGACDAGGEHCDYTFTLDDDTEWVKVYVDLAGVVDPGGVGIVLLGPDGRSVAPFRFGEEWSPVADTGMLGRRPTTTINVIWAHQVSRQLYGSEWDGSQTWTVRFSGPEAARARAGIRKDERGQPTIQSLAVIDGSLTGTIVPAPKDEEEAMVSLRLNDGRHIGVSEIARRVASDGRFKIPGIVDLVLGTTGDDDHLAINACTATVVVSLAKTVHFGAFSGVWHAPLSDSSAGVPVPRALCGVEGRRTPLPTLVEFVPADPFDPSGSFRVTVDGGLLDGALSVQEVDVDVSGGSGPGDVVLGAWARDWRCEVAADARGQDCREPFVVELSSNAAAEVDIRVVFRASTADPLQDPPQSDRTTLVVRGIRLDGRLPRVTGAEPGGPFDPSGSVLVTAEGGWQDGILSYDASSGGIRVITVEGPEPQLRPDSTWRCEVPAEAVEHDCPLWDVDATLENDAVVDLRLPLRAESVDPAWKSTEAQSINVDAVPLRTRARGEVLGHFLRYLVVVAAALLLMRGVAAWMRRRWMPLPRQQNAYFTATARRENGRMSIDGPPRTVISSSLVRARGSAALGPVKLHVRWWPLFRGGPVEVIATPTGKQKIVASSGTLITGLARRKTVGRIGRNLEKGWVAFEDRSGGGRYTLVYWDTPDGDDEAARARELWDKVGAALDAEVAKEPSDEPASSGEQSRSSPASTQARPDSRSDRWPRPPTGNSYA